MYDWLYDISLLVNKQAPGIGTEKRHSPSFDTQGDNKFDIGTYMPMLMELYAKAREQVRISNSSKGHKQAWVELHTRIVDDIPRIAGLKALELIQLSSMMGLLPIQFTKYASIQSDSDKANDGNRGPVKLLRAVCLKKSAQGTLIGPSSKSDLSSIFKSLYDELGTIFGTGSGGIHSVSESLLENTMCELYRILRAYVKLKYGMGRKRKVEVESKITVENFMEAFDDERYHNVMSLVPVVDAMFIYRNRGSNLPMQNFFKVTRSGTKLRLQMFVIDHLENMNNVHRFQMFMQGNSHEKTDLLSWVQSEDDGGSLVNSFLSLHPCVLKIYETVAKSEKILDKTYIHSFKSSGENIVWKKIKSSPDLAVDSEKYFLHCKIPTARKNRTPKMNEINDKIEKRVQSMKDKKNNDQNRKRKTSKTVTSKRTKNQKSKKKSKL